MPKTKVLFFRDEDGSVPLKRFLEALIPKARAKCIVAIVRLGECGHEPRRPDADFLRDGIYELRVRLQKVNYRILYFFQGKNVAVVSHGTTKRDRVPEKEIKLALKRRGLFEAAPEKHTATG